MRSWLGPKDVRGRYYLPFRMYGSIPVHVVAVETQSRLGWQLEVNIKPNPGCSERLSGDSWRILSTSVAFAKDSIQLVDLAC